MGIKGEKEGRANGTAATEHTTAGREQRASGGKEGREERGTRQQAGSRERTKKKRDINI